MQLKIILRTNKRFKCLHPLNILLQASVAIEKIGYSAKPVEARENAPSTWIDGNDDFH